MEEKIIQEANQYKKETRGSIYDGTVTVKGTAYTFTRQLYFEDRLSIYLPENFIELPDAIKKLKYPGEGRPQVIRTIPCGGVDFGINMLPLAGSDEMTRQFGAQMYQLTRNMRPAEMYLEKETQVNDRTGRVIDWFAYVSHGMDARIYNLIGTTYAAGQAINFVFNCAAQDKDMWRDVALEVFQSINDNEIGE